MNERQYHLVKVIQKIGVFEGFELPDIQRLLRVAGLKSYRAREDIYTIGDPSLELMVLLKGKLSVQGESGEELAEIRPGTPVGEMGVFTGQPRSATIQAAVDCTALVLGKEELSGLLSANKDMYVTVLMNLVRILSERLAQANQLNESHARIIRDLESQLDELESGVPVD